MGEVIKIGGIFLLSAVKFAFAPGAAILAGYSFWETLGMTMSGGIFGVFLFYYFGLYVMKIMAKWKGKPFLVGNRFEPLVFNRGSRKLIKVKQNFGLIGLVVLTPVLISIPIGCVVAARFFSQNRLTLPMMATSVVFWALIITWFSTVFKMNILD